LKGDGQVDVDDRLHARAVQVDHGTRKNRLG